MLYWGSCAGKAHFQKRIWRQKHANFAIFNTCWFLCNILLYLAPTNDMRWIFFLTLFDLYWQIFRRFLKLWYFSLEIWHFAEKNMLLDSFPAGYPIWKCELWLDLSNKTQRRNSAECDHELFIQSIYEKQSPYYMHIFNGVSPRRNMDKFYVEKNTLMVKHIFNYNIGLSCLST